MAVSVWLPCSKVLLFIAAYNHLQYPNMEALNEIQPTSKDCKLLIPALINFLNSFETKYEEMFTSMKTEFLAAITERDSKIVNMENETSLLKKRILALEDRIEENEAYERRDTLIISGSSIPPAQENENCSLAVRNLFKDKLNVVVSEGDISVSHRLGAKMNSQRQDKRSFIVKFCRRSTKTDLMASARKKKPANFFVNECLTPTQRAIGYVLRKAKREFPNIVSGSTTFDGKHFVWVKSPNPDARGARDSKQPISSYERLKTFCNQVLGKPVDHFTDTWPH